jgi:hypothetical protein
LPAAQFGDPTRLIDDAQLDELKRQFMAATWSMDRRGRRVVCPKDEQKQKLGCSPDGADAVNSSLTKGVLTMSLNKLALVLATWVITTGCGWVAQRSLAAKPENPADKAAKDALADTELHMVCLHTGVTKTDGQIHGGRATVTVNRPGKTVVLFLSAYETVTWKVMPAKDTRIGKIILGGYHEQAISSLPKDAELLEVNYEKTKNGDLLGDVSGTCVPGVFGWSHTSASWKGMSMSLILRCSKGPIMAR